jgi:hypothetical protein
LKGITYRIEQFGGDALPGARQGGFISADVVRVRENFTPGLTRLDADGVGDLPLGDDEYLGEETALLFHEKLCVLTLQSNRFGIGATNLALYLQKLLNRDVPPPALVFDHDAISARLKRIKVVKKLEVEVAKAGPSKLRELGLSSDAIIKLMSTPGVERLKLTLKAGWGGGIDGAKDIAKALAQFADGDEEDVLRSARIVGQDDLGEMSVLDLLEPKMVERPTVHFPENVTRVPHTSRLGGLKDAFDNRHAALRKLLE